MICIRVADKQHSVDLTRELGVVQSKNHLLLAMVTNSMSYPMLKNRGLLDPTAYAYGEETFEVEWLLFMLGSVFHNLVVYSRARRIVLYRQIG